MKKRWIALLLAEYWQGDVMQEMAHIRVRYADGTEVRIPLREEFELCGSFRNREPQAALYVVFCIELRVNLTVFHAKIGEGFHFGGDF